MIEATRFVPYPPPVGMLFIASPSGASPPPDPLPAEFCKFSLKLAFTQASLSRCEYKVQIQLSIFSTLSF